MKLVSPYPRPWDVKAPWQAESQLCKAVGLKEQTMTNPQFQSLEEGGGCGSKHNSVHRTEDWVKGKQGAWAILTYW